VTTGGGTITSTYDTCTYVVTGSLRMESGPGGANVVQAGSGDFLHVPKGAIHRDSNRATRRPSSSWYDAGTAQPWSTSTGPHNGESRVRRPGRGVTLCGISRLKLNHAIVIRYDKLTVRDRAIVHFVAINKWL
jgi:hypothetical protein